MFKQFKGNEVKKDGKKKTMDVPGGRKVMTDEQKTTMSQPEKEEHCSFDANSFTEKPCTNLQATSTAQ